MKLNDKDKKLGKIIFDKMLENSKLSRDELIKNWKDNNIDPDKMFCGPCMIGNHESCTYKKDKRRKCNCKKCTVSFISKKWN